MSKAYTAASKEQLVELMQYLSQNISVPTIGIGGGFAPIGTIISYMGTTAPQDYLICDGTTYNIADYKQLSDFFAAQFGSANFFGGDGVTTFKVPDLRGEFLRGTGTNSHTNQGSGANVGVHQDGSGIRNMVYTKDGNTLHIVGNSDDPAYSSIIFDKDSSYGSQTTSYKITATSDYGSGNALIRTTRPTNTSVLYCIKAVAAGDVYSTEERVVGTWIDGKPVYEKTIDATSYTLTNSGTTTIHTGITTVDNLINITGLLWHNDGGYWRGLPMIQDNDATRNSTPLNFNKNSGDISISTRSNAYASAFSLTYITIRYTKTTD